MSASRKSSARPTKASAVAAKRAVAAARAHEVRQRKIITAVGVAVVVIAAVVIGLVVANSGSGSAESTDPTKVAAGFPESVRNDDGVVMAKAGAKVTVEMYVDLQCPACKEYETRVASTLEKLVADGTVKLVVHPVAILDRMSSTEYSTRAGAAVGCAADEGKFWQYTKVLYSEQPPENGDGLPASKLVSLGAKVGLTSDTFTTCVTDETYRQWVTDLTKAASDEISGTPTVLVDGKTVADASAQGLEDAVNAALDGQT